MPLIPAKFVRSQSPLVGSSQLFLGSIAGRAHVARSGRSGYMTICGEPTGKQGVDPDAMMCPICLWAITTKTQRQKAKAACHRCGAVPHAYWRDEKTTLCGYCQHVLGSQYGPLV